MNIEWTCLGCPMQAEGQLDDGRWFYFRYRWGRATFGVGETFAEAIDDPNTVGVNYGDDGQGVLGMDGEAEALLRRVMTLRLGGPVAPQIAGVW